MHWNANSIDKEKQPIEEFEAYIKQNNIQVVSINETKLADTDQLNIKNYNIIRKDRNSHGGGVAILINDQLEYEQLNDYDQYDLELLAIKVSIKNFSFTFLTLYLPPGAQFPNDNFFTTLSNTKNLILCGDLNSKSKAWYSKKRNQNGILLEQVISEQDLTIVNNKKPTFYFKQTNTLDILDLIITTPDILNKITNLHIPQNHLSSDHFPMIFELDNVRFEATKNKIIKRINHEIFHNAIEDKCTLFFNNNLQNKTNNISILYSVFEKIIEHAKQSATKTFSKKVDNINLPKHILDLIKHKKTARKTHNKSQSQTSKTILNKLTKQVQDEIKNFKIIKFEKECDKLADMNACESKFWSLLKRIENNNHNEQKNIPYLLINNIKIFNDKDKSEHFAELQANIFTPYQDSIFDNDFKIMVDNFVKSNELFDYQSESSYNAPFSLTELEQVLSNIKPKAKGPNSITNNTLKHLAQNGKQFLLNIVNNSFINNCIPNELKMAKVIMIPKKHNDRHNPNNYRPISLTNTIVKIIEKLIKIRLVHYLESNNLFIKNQSGFRSHKRTIDNIFFIKQKSLEAFTKKRAKSVMKVGGIVFDIEKAFDKVWHEGLLFKMHQLKVPSKIAQWIKNFLSNRTFYVNVNGKDSKQHPIYTGVPQGAILSPILFLIFINDIPTTVEKYRYLNYSLLFADDLSHFSADFNLKYLQAKLQAYLDLLEQWLIKWRLKTATNKCTYNIYTENGNCQDELNLTLFNQQIKKENNSKYLGIYLDQNLNFGHHVNELKEKCMRKMNFIKVLKSKKWNAKTKTKINVYNSMIRSNIDYAGPLLENISEFNKNKIETIQYHGMVHILNMPKGSSHTEMRNELKLKTLSERNRDLKIRYIRDSLSNNQLIKDLLSEHVKFNEDHNITDDSNSMFRLSI